MKLNDLSRLKVQGKTEKGLAEDQVPVMEEPHAEAVKAKGQVWRKHRACF